MNGGPVELRRGAEARVWRLALLLTGDAGLAAEVAIQVRRAQPRLEGLEARRLDRLVVLRAREVGAQAARARRGAAGAGGGAPAAPEGEVGELWRALRWLEEQPREAWIFARLDELGEVEMARSMDCSKTAAARYLAEADQALAAQLGVAGAAGMAEPIALVRAWLEGLDPQAAIAARRAVRHRRRRVIVGLMVSVWALTVVAVVGAAAVMAWVILG